MEKLQSELFEFLNKLGINAVTKTHPKSPTIEEWKKYVPDLFPNGTKCKNLFLKEKGKEIYYLISAHFETEIDLGAFSKSVGLKNLRLTTKEDLLKFLGVEPGTVTPFGLFVSNYLNSYKVNVVIDEKLKDEKELLFHPLSNDASTSISGKDLDLFLSSLKLDHKWINFSKLK